MKTTLLSLFISLIAYTGFGQCDAVSSINENFDDWGDSIDDCWNTVTAGAFVYSEEGSVTFYSFSSPNTDTMLITPEIVAGTYTLAFDAGVISGSSTSIGLQVQVGKVSDNTSAATFTPIGSAFNMTTTDTTYSLEVSLEAGEYLVFNANLPLPHAALHIDNVVFGQCLSASINENFDDWGSSIDDCWNTVTAGAFVYSEEGSVTFYSFSSPNTDTMLITPEIVAGTYTLAFDAGVISGSSTSTGLQVQVGKVSDNTSAATFTPIGSAFNMTTTDTTYSLEVSLEAGEYLVFNANLPLPHAALHIDNVVLSNALSTPDYAQSNLEIKVYPNPSNGIINMAYDLNRLGSNHGSIIIYNIMGAKVFETTLSNNDLNNKPLNLSHLQAGGYVLQFISGDVTVTKKLIIN